MKYTQDDKISNKLFLISLITLISIFVLSFAVKHRHLVNILNYIFYIPLFISIIGIIIGIYQLIAKQVESNNYIKIGIIKNFVIVIFYILIYVWLEYFFIPR